MCLPFKLGDLRFELLVCQDLVVRLFDELAQFLNGIRPVNPS